MVLGIRGTFSDKPINIIDAFESGSTAQSNLVLNGVFTLYHHARGCKEYRQPSLLHLFEEALRIARTPVNDGNNPTPLILSLRERKQLSPSPLQGGLGWGWGTQSHNVVLMLMES